MLLVACIGAVSLPAPQGPPPLLPPAPLYPEPYPLTSPPTTPHSPPPTFPASSGPVVRPKLGEHRHRDAPKPKPADDKKKPVVPSLFKPNHPPFGIAVIDPAGIIR